MQLLWAKNITIAAHHRANYMNITGNAVCCVITLTETFTGPDIVVYFVTLTWAI